MKVFIKEASTPLTYDELREWLRHREIPAELFEPKLRWPGAPLICLATNLPALPSREALERFLKINGPSCPVHHIGKCGVCGLWHAETSAPDPTGSSNGSGRSTKGH
jgi:hypothetical protein